MDTNDETFCCGYWLDAVLACNDVRTPFHTDDTSPPLVGVDRHKEVGGSQDVALDLK